MTNALYYGDNLSVLRESIATESIDLISTRRSTRTLPTTSCVFERLDLRSRLRAGRWAWIAALTAICIFRDADKKPQFAVISVKGGGIKLGDVRDLKGTMEREKAALGLFLTLNEPTREMEKEAASAGLYETGGMKVPKLQNSNSSPNSAGQERLL